MSNDNITQPIEECDDYICDCCGNVYTGTDWREVDGELICPDCMDKNNKRIVAEINKT
jgi:rubredoxin